MKNAASQEASKSYGFQSILVAHAVRKGIILPDLRSGPWSEARAVLPKLDERQKGIMKGTMAIGEGRDLDEGAMASFLSMAPGVRDLAMRNWISSLFSCGRWREVPLFEQALGELPLTPPTKEERLKALQEGPLTPDQRRILGAFQLEGSKALDARELLLIRKSLLELRSAQHPERHLGLWKDSSHTALMVSDISYKSRYATAPSYTDYELAFLQDLLGEDVRRKDPGKSADRLREAFTRKMEGGRFCDIIAQGARSCDMGSLLRSARVQSEHRTLLRFLDLPEHSVFFSPGAGAVESSHGSAGARGDTSQSQDRTSSFRLSLPEGKALAVNAVFDGAGGHANGGQASALARDVLEIFAISGWLKGPEDARKALLCADALIISENVSSHTDPASAVSERDLWMSTAAIALHDGSRLHAIHCGDSQVVLSTGGHVRFETLAHTVENDFELQQMMRRSGRAIGNSSALTSALGGFSARISVNNSDARGSAPPIEAGAGSAIIVCSDGVSKRLTPESISSMTLLLADDPSSLASNLVRLSAPAEGSVSDDRTAIVLLIPPEGAREAPLSQAGFDDLPRLLRQDPLRALNDERIGTLAGICKHEGTPTEDVLRTLGPLAEALGEPRNGDSGSAFTTISRTIFSIIQSREDQAMLCRRLVPALQKHNRRLLKSLTDAPEAYPYMEAMVSFLEQSVPFRDLEPLLSAKSPQIRERALRIPGIAGHLPAVERLLDVLEPRIHSAPDRSLLELPEYRKVVMFIANNETDLEDVLQVMGRLITIFEQAPAGNGGEGRDVLLSSIFSALTKREDREELLSFLQTSENLSQWSSYLVRKLSNEPSINPAKALMFDFVERTSSPDDLRPLLNSKSPQISTWAEESLTGKRGRPVL